MTAVYLIRHAEAEGNLFRRVHGHFDGFVTPNGHKQIALLRRRFENVKIDAVYSSDLTRTMTTARAIYEPRGLTLNTDARFREVSLGVWEDRPWGELKASHPLEYELWTCRPWEFNIAGGESFQEVLARFLPALMQAVEKNPDGAIAVVSHGALIRAALSFFKFGTLSRICEIPWGDNTCVAKLVFSNGSHTLEYLNDNSHLQSFSTLEKQSWWRKNDNPDAFNLYMKNAALPSDEKTLMNYYIASWEHVFDDKCDTVYGRNLIRRLSRENPGCIAFAMRGDEDVGVIMLDTGVCLAPKAGHISLIYIKSEERAKGYGSQLIGYALSFYRAQGLEHITVRVASSNTAAIRFYEKCGFSESHREYFKSYTQIIMKL